VDPSVLKTYKPHEDWKKTDEEDPKAKALNIRREAAFKVFGEGSEALVTVIPMPNTGGMQEMRGNIERWAGQVGLPPPTPEQLRDLLTGITVDDIEDCLLIDLRGPKDRSVVVVVPLADKNWIFKITGPEKLVGAQKDKFETFVKSAKFEGGR